jgi:hypothetical protein
MARNVAISSGHNEEAQHRYKEIDFFTWTSCIIAGVQLSLHFRNRILFNIDLPSPEPVRSGVLQSPTWRSINLPFPKIRYLPLPRRLPNTGLEPLLLRKPSNRILER